MITSPVDLCVVGDTLHLVSSDSAALAPAFGGRLVDPQYRPAITGTRSGWSVPIDGLAPEMLVALAGNPVTTQVVELARFVSAVLDACATGRMVPCYDRRVPRMLAVSPQIALSTGALVKMLPSWYASETALANLCSDISERHARLVPPKPDPLIRDWAEATRDRLATGARFALRLNPPDDVCTTWTLAPWIISLNDPTTMLEYDPASNASVLGCTRGDLEQLVTRGWRTLSDETHVRTAFGSTPQEVELDDDHVIKVLRATTALAARGVDILTPPGILRPRKVHSRAKASGTPSGLQTIDLKLQVNVEVHDEDGQVLSLSENDVNRLALAKSNLVELGGRWMVVDASGARNASRLVARAKQQLSAADLLYADEDLTSMDLAGVTGWVGTALRGETFSAAEARDAHEDVRAQLRHYQRDGLGWMTWLEETGIGGVLADDMGLGKTLQVLARTVADHAGPTLVVCPASVVSNWVREAQKFAPTLRVGVFHGPDRGSVAGLAADRDLIVTTYGVLRRDTTLVEQCWHRVVLDEAQFIKNPMTAGARAARALRATHRLALTGTPVENHLGDLWSIMQFAEPGLLGARANFNQRFVTDSPDPTDVAALTRLISPVMLRRTKLDPGVADELPKKIDHRVDCAMSTEQIGLYEATVRTLLEDSAHCVGIDRRGKILGALTRLKMICAHPSMIADQSTLSHRSGKLNRLTDLLAEITAAGDATIVFSQFASLLAPMAKHLEQVLGVPVLYFTGKTPPADRTSIVDQFMSESGPPILLISLKSGGVGLNLTRANHVVHYDQWWNPAVEDQASDRAWRIGQQKTVQVHHLVCPGTLEERIAELVQSKRAIAAAVTGLRALSELDTAGLSELVTLSREQIVGAG